MVDLDENADRAQQNSLNYKLQVGISFLCIFEGIIFKEAAPQGTHKCHCLNVTSRIVPLLYHILPIEEKRVEKSCNIGLA